jgi:diguanylate cyclase (GGDEF)-like protein
VYIVSDGDLVVHSRPELVKDSLAGTPISAVGDEPTIAASNLAAGGDGWQILSVNDEAFHAVSHQIDDIPGLTWTVITVGPDDDFRFRFTHLRNTDAKKLGAIALLSILLAIPLARLAARDVGSLHTAAHRDSLTGLVNRRTFEKHGAVLIASARRRRRSVGALMVDIDHFKQLNDTYGHHAGDEVLEAVAGRISHSVAKTDLVARLGGDEIALLLGGADLAASQSVAARLRNAVTASPISTNRGPIYVTVSIGASATGGADRARLEDVLKAADRALYASKRAGRDRITAVQIARTH